MRSPKILSISLSISLVFPLAGFAQSNAVYDLSHNVVAGGGDVSADAVFRIEGTAGQTVAGNVSGSALYNLHSGFWSPPGLAPTAAAVAVTGRVNSLQGTIGRRVKILLTDLATGTIRTAQANPFGYYRFENVGVGRIYLLRAESKSFQFTPDSYVFMLLDARDDFDFSAVEIQ